MAWRRAADGTLSFMMVEPGLVGTEFTQGQRNAKPVLVITEGANEYVFTARDN